MRYFWHTLRTYETGCTQIFQQNLLKIFDFYYRNEQLSFANLVSSGTIPNIILMPICHYIIVMAQNVTNNQDQ